MFPFIAGSSVHANVLCLLTLLWAGTGAREGQNWGSSRAGRDLVLEGQDPAGLK